MKRLNSSLKLSENSSIEVEGPMGIRFLALTEVHGGHRFEEAREIGRGQ
jgi:hypothetical protein